MLRKFTPITLVFAMLFSMTAIHAQDIETFPTVDALNAAVVPPRDLLDLAQRLEGVDTVAPPPVNPAPLEVGAVRSLWATNSSSDFSFQFDAELRVVGDHIYIWVEQGQPLDQGALDFLASEFDSRVYEATRDLWGSEASPGVDGDPRVHIVFVDDLGFSVGAYYASKHSYPIEAVPTSNEMEMMFFNLTTIDYLLGSDIITTIAAHEFQHMIRANVDQNEDGWMDEGFSTFTEWYLGDTNLGFVNEYLFNPNVQLNTWTEDGNTTPDYGASQLWITYLYERFGVEGLQALSADPANGMFGIDNLAATNGTDANTIFADWVVANYLVDPKRTNNPDYGYAQLRGLGGVGTITYNALPIEERRTIRQYAAQYLRVEDLGGASSLSIEMTAPGTVGLAPTKSPSATPLWYSNRGDDSNTHLTIPLDLTTLQSPVLSYDVWYHIEDLWDYGYTMISTDDGATWDILATPEMTDENPHFNGYGFGYTGRSSSWISEQIDLSAYAGQNVLLRFEMIYDDAVNQPGMFLDYIALVDDATEQAMYNDFSDPTLMSDFQAAGWVLTDNRLPQSVWVQAIQEMGSEATVTRWLHTGGTSIYDLPLEAGASQITVVLSPFAPTTTVPVEVTLNVTAN